MAYRKENEELLAKLRPGDIVKFKRSSLLSDFAIYVGDGKVVYMKGKGFYSQNPQVALFAFMAAGSLYLNRLKDVEKLRRERFLGFDESLKTWTSKRDAKK